MAMTVNKLYRVLGEMIAAGKGYRPVCVDKGSFQDNRESDGVTVLDLHTVKTSCIVLADDDGGIAVNKDGTEKTRNVVILGGNASDQS